MSRGRSSSNDGGRRYALPVCRASGAIRALKNSVCACQCKQDRGFVSAALGLVVGDDDNCPARIASRVLLDIRGGVHQPARDIGATFESFAIEHAFEFPLSIQVAGAKRHAQAREAIEYHRSDPVLVPKRAQSLMRSVSHAPYVWLHAMADIQEQDEVKRHFLALEIPYLQRPSIHSQDEILDSETANGMVSTIHYLSIHTSQRDIATKSNGRVIGW